MKTESFKSIAESVKRIMLGEAPVTPAPPEVDAAATDAQDTVAPEEAPEAEVEAPEAEEPEAPMKSNGKGKLKYAAICNKDGQENTILLSKDGLEEFIHDNGTKCITALYELGKETKVPTVKVKV